VDAAEACAIGLVTRVVDAPLDAALALARRIADHSPDAIRAARRLLREAPDLDLAGRMRLEEALQVPLLGSANQLEAVMATMQRRPPQFVDPAT
jgi:enoyl-CoA hydratase/carnithine racemase